jgi:hypothetical protein
VRLNLLVCYTYIPMGCNIIFLGYRFETIKIDLFLLVCIGLPLGVRDQSSGTNPTNIGQNRSFCRSLASMYGASHHFPANLRLGECGLSLFVKYLYIGFIYNT